MTMITRPVSSLYKKHRIRGVGLGAFPVLRTARIETMTMVTRSLYGKTLAITQKNLPRSACAGLAPPSMKWAVPGEMCVKARTRDRDDSAGARQARENGVTLFTQSRQHARSHPRFLLRRAIAMVVLDHVHILKHTPSVTHRCRSLTPPATTSDSRGTDVTASTTSAGD